MAPGQTGRNISRKKRKVQRNWNSSWSENLKEIAVWLPISDPNGRGLTKKDTLVHTLQYLDFLQNHIQSLQKRLPPHCLPRSRGRGWSGCESKKKTQSELSLEPHTPPCSLKPNRKHVCGCPRKRPAPGTELWADEQEKRWKLYKVEPDGSDIFIEDKEETLPMWSGRCDWSEPQPVVGQGAWPLQDCDSLPSSLDSPFSPGQLFTLSAHTGEASGEQPLGFPGDGGHCSDCEEQTGSKESSPSSGILDSPIGSWSLLLRDHMLDSPVAVESSPRQASLLPLMSACGTGDSLNLSPSLLSSPARGLSLSHCILPEGQELQALFEEVWVTPKSSTPNVSSLLCTSPADQVSKWEVAVGNSVGSVLSESEDCTWTSTQRGYDQRRKRATARDQRPLPRSNLKKKCINGFIMFCRINRKLYLQTHPGTPSTMVTKELANLWHVMPKQERCVYCMKALRFSRQQNRNVRSPVTEGEREEGMASPLHMLLAHRDLYAATREHY